MSSLELNNLTKQFGDFTAVNHINLSVNDGETVALLGGSGCGKTTTLRMIAGFLEPTEGAIIVGGQEMNKIPPYKRNIGIFFQNYALFPHLSTFDNIAFGLKLKKLPKKEIKEKVNKMLNLVKLTGMEKRYPRELSGGQQQRVALARALVTEPSILLLDEPLSNLDAKLRVEMQTEIKRIQKELGITTIIVTHDQEEAVSLADRVIVMNKGEILQIGKPKEVFDTPTSLFVADFMGFSNFFAGTVTKVEGDTVKVLCSNSKTVAVTTKEAHTFQPNDPVQLTIRPENIDIHSEKSSLTGKIEQITYKGNVTRIELSNIFDEHLFVNVHDYDGADVGEELSISLPSHKLLIYKH